MSLTCRVFGHEDTRERDGETYVLVCDRCGSRRQMLTTALIRGPRHEPAPVLGQPTSHAKKVTRQNVTRFERVSDSQR